ncbi:MAG: hypothetical protein V4604_06935 [Bacteroidota bacterium]
MNYLKQPILLVFSMICFSGFGQAGIVSVTEYDEILYFNCATHEDTVLLDLNIAYPDLLIPGYEGASDPYNNRYFFGAYTDLFSSSLRIFTYDLLSESLTASDAFSFEEIYYDPFENRIMFRDSNYLKSYNLDNGVIATIGPLPDQTSSYYGQHQVYDFVNQQLFYDFPCEAECYHHVVFDLSTGTVVKDTIIDNHQLANMQVYDDRTNTCYAMFNDGDIVSVDLPTTARTYITTIPDWHSMLNEEMAMFDQLKGHYILPYWSTGGESKIATIDVINQTMIANSLYPMSSYNQLFTTFQAPVRVSGGELTTVHAEGYQWYINGVPEAGATQQSIQTSVDGEYYAKVTCAGGRTINSDTISVQALAVSHLNAPETITVNPNPLQETSEIDLSKLEGSAFHLKVYNATGELALQLNATDQESFQILQEQLHRGMFFFLLENESGFIGKGKFVVE